jgi:hypothetical protein
LLGAGSVQLVSAARAARAMTGRAA